MSRLKRIALEVDHQFVHLGSDFLETGTFSADVIMLQISAMTRHEYGGQQYQNSPHTLHCFPRHTK
jgi:methionine synthase I (cobalamin-dependent)